MIQESVSMNLNQPNVERLKVCYLIKIVNLQLLEKEMEEEGALSFKVAFKVDQLKHKIMLKLKQMLG